MSDLVPHYIDNHPWLFKGLTRRRVLRTLCRIRAANTAPPADSGPRLSAVDAETGMRRYNVRSADIIPYPRCRFYLEFDFIYSEGGSCPSEPFSS